jgi:6-phosphogluconate dehydrogenase
MEMGSICNPGSLMGSRTRLPRILVSLNSSYIVSIALLTVSYMLFLDDSEGTGVWTLREIAGRHVPAPTIAAAHQLRLTSATRRSRLKVHDVLRLPVPKMLAKDASFGKDEFVKDLKLAVYAGILGAYVQGMNVGHAWSTWLGDIH